LQKSQQNISELIIKNNHCELSIYNDNLTTDNVIENVSKIKKAFPILSAGFFDIFQERLKNKGFTDQKLNDAVNYVIDNCIYPTPTIANFLSFDKHIKLYTYDQMLQMPDVKFAFEIYRPIKMTGREKPLYASKENIKKYNFKKWNLKNKEI